MNFADVWVVCFQGRREILEPERFFLGSSRPGLIDRVVFVLPGFQEAQKFSGFSQKSSRGWFLRGRMGVLPLRSLHANEPILSYFSPISLRSRDIGMTNLIGNGAKVLDFLQNSGKIQ